VYGNRLCVKLAEGCGAELQNGVLRSRTGMDLSPVLPLFARATAEPLFPAASWDELDRLHENACAKLPPGNRPGHLGLWFRLTTESADAADRLTDALFDCALVDHVHKEPQATPASCGMPAPLPSGDIAPPTPLFTQLQLTHQPSPLGYGVWRSQGIYGARGQNVGMVMVESDWIVDHEDVHQLVLGNFIGPPSTQNTSEAHHGLAGASIVSADRNEYGITGATDEVALRFLALGTNGGIANAILLAGINSQPGDVSMMVLMFLLGQTSSTDWVPMEFLQSVFDVTLTVTANGLLFVTTAANGDSNLDDPRLLRRFDRGFRDSGAIFVAATDGSQMTRATYSNYGTRVDTNGWGQNVAACGYGSIFYPNLDLRQTYTSIYAGTSAAVPGIAAVAIALQGAARAQLGRSLSLAELLNLLHTYGTVSPDVIGRRPDLFAMLQALGAVDGLEMSWPDVALGGTVTVDLYGAAGSAGFLFWSFGTGSTDFGYNRKVLLDLGTLQPAGLLLMPAGTASWPLFVPSIAALHGASLYFQAGLLQGSAPIHVTNSGQVTVL
jgi:serine protease